MASITGGYNEIWGLREKKQWFGFIEMFTGMEVCRLDNVQ